MIDYSSQGVNESRFPYLTEDDEGEEKTADELELDDLDLDEEDVEAKTKRIKFFCHRKKKLDEFCKGI